MAQAEEKKGSDETEQTLALIKPDAVKAGNARAITARIRSEGFTILEQRVTQLTKEQAEGFYAEHKERSFFNDLVTFMTSGPIYILKLERRNAILAWRTIMGPTNVETAKKDAPNCIRALYGSNIQENATHGSDSEASAQRELNYFFGNEQTLALIKPDAMAAGKAPQIIERIQKEGFVILDRIELQLTTERAKAFYAEHAERGFYNDLVTFMTSGPITALKLQKENAIKAWRDLMGPTNSEAARKDAPNSIRALFGTDMQNNATHGSDGYYSARRELSFFFPIEETLGLIKPDAVSAGNAEKIMDRIELEGFKIVVSEKLTLTKERAEGFYAEHKERAFFNDLVTFMTSGPIYALKLERSNAIVSWRKLMGPTNAEAARNEDPNCLRALFGTNIEKNATHGSDSRASAEREVNYFFEMQDTLAMIKPDAVEAGNAPAILDRIRSEGFKIVEENKLLLTKERAQEFYAEHKERGFFNDLVTFMTSGEIYALKLRKENGIIAWRNLMGPTNSEAARKDAPNSIRALFGTDIEKNACHGSDSVKSAARELEFHFPTQYTLALIKPDAVKAGNDYAILRAIRLAGFRIIELQQVQLTKERAEGFYVEHKERGFFNDLVAFMTSGPIFALKLEKVDAIKAWRTLMGPTNSEVARKEAPNSIRARFGTNVEKNATHGSDGVESAQRELTYFFG